jgi:hypothetical protein
MSWLQYLAIESNKVFDNTKLKLFNKVGKNGPQCFAPSERVGPILPLPAKRWCCGPQVPLPDVSGGFWFKK